MILGAGYNTESMTLKGDGVKFVLTKPAQSVYAIIGTGVVTRENIIVDLIGQAGYTFAAPRGSIQEGDVYNLQTSGGTCLGLKLSIGQQLNKHLGVTLQAGLRYYKLKSEDVYGSSRHTVYTVPMGVSLVYSL